MAIVTVVKNLPSVPSKDVAKQQVSRFMNELITLWAETHGGFIAGKTFHFLAFPPGAYGPAKSGIVRNASAFEQSAGGTVPHAFAITDDAAASASPFALWTLDPNPDFWPGEIDKYRKGGGPITGSSQV